MIEIYIAGRIVQIAGRAIGRQLDNAETRANQRRIDKYHRESPLLYARASAAAEKHGWDIREEEAENVLAYFLERIGGDPLAALRAYTTSLESGQRHPADQRSILLAGYRLRRLQGRSTETDRGIHRSIRSKELRSSLRFFVGAAVSAFAVYLCVQWNSRFGNDPLQGFVFLISCVSFFYFIVKGLATAKPDPFF